MLARVRHLFTRIHNAWSKLPADGQPVAGSGLDIYAERLRQRIENGEFVVR